MNDTQNLLSVLVVDSNKIFRDGLALTLRDITYMDKIYQTDNSQDALSELKNNHYDIVFIDNYQAFLNGALYTHKIKINDPQMMVICISIYNDEDHIIDMFKNGVDGYLLNNTDKTEIEIAIINVLKGKHYFSKDIPTKIIDKILKNVIFTPVKKPRNLNEREKEILRFIYEEYTSKEIADKLFLSERTIEFYRQTLIRKTGSRNIIGVIKYALNNGLIQKP